MVHRLDQAAQLMDFSIFDLIRECIEVSQFAMGAITLSDLRELRWSEYDELVKQVRSARKEQEKSPDGGR